MLCIENLAAGVTDYSCRLLGNYNSMANRNYNGSGTVRSVQGKSYSSKKSVSSNQQGRWRRIDGESQGPIFQDPRDKSDRRSKSNELAIPSSGCRRRNERRSDRINLGVWWMKRNYCVDRVAAESPLSRKPSIKPATSKS